MARPLDWLRIVIVLVITLTGACERQPRAREREAAEAAEAEAKSRARAAEAARRAAEPLAEEPAVETLRVPRSGLPCKVDDVFASKCRRCHTIPTRHGAPFVFFTWEDTRQDRAGQPLYAVIGRAVRTNFMPYRVEANPPVQQLTDEEKKTVLDWVDAGAPREDCELGAPDGKKAAPTQAQKSSKKTKAQASALPAP